MACVRFCVMYVIYMVFLNFINFLRGSDYCDVFFIVEEMEVSRGV